MWLKKKYVPTDWAEQGIDEVSEGGQEEKEVNQIRHYNE